MPERTAILTGYLSVTNTANTTLVGTHIVGVTTDPALVVIKIISPVPVVVIVIVIVAGHRGGDSCAGQGADQKAGKRIPTLVIVAALAFWGRRGAHGKVRPAAIGDPYAFGVKSPGIVLPAALGAVLVAKGNPAARIRRTTALRPPRESQRTTVSAPTDSSNSELTISSATALTKNDLRDSMIEPTFQTRTRES